MTTEEFIKYLSTITSELNFSDKEEKSTEERVEALESEVKELKEEIKALKKMITDNETSDKDIANQLSITKKEVSGLYVMLDNIQYLVKEMHDRFESEEEEHCGCCENCNCECCEEDEDEELFEDFISGEYLVLDDGYGGEIIVHRITPGADIEEAFLRHLDRV